MHATRPGAALRVGREEAFELAHDGVEVAGLLPSGRGIGVAVHRIAGPHNRVAGVADRDEQWHEGVDHLVGAHASDEREAAGDAIGVERFAQSEHVLGGRSRTHLAPDGVLHPLEERDVRAVELTRAFADPQHVRRAVVPVAGEGVDAGERLLVAEYEGLVAGEEVDRVELFLGLGRDTARPHEAQRAVDARSELLVAAAFGARRNELAVPGVHAVQVGEAALGERAQQVQRGRRMVVRLDDARRVGSASGFGERDVVHDVAAERGERDTVNGLLGRRAGLCVLPGDSADLHHWHAGRVGERHRHLQDDPQLLADVVGARVERLGAIAGLQQERLAPGHFCQQRGKRACLAGKDEGWPFAERLDDVVDFAAVGPGGLLHGGVRAPDRRRPLVGGVGDSGCVTHGQRIPGRTRLAQSDRGTLRHLTREESRARGWGHGSLQYGLVSWTGDWFRPRRCSRPQPGRARR